MSEGILGGKYSIGGEFRMARSISQKPPVSHLEGIWILTVCLRPAALEMPDVPFSLLLKNKVVERLRWGPGLPGYGKQALHCATKTSLWLISIENLTAQFCQLSTSAHAKFTQ